MPWRRRRRRPCSPWMMPPPRLPASARVSVAQRRRGAHFRERECVGVVCLGIKRALDLNKACLLDTVPILLLYRPHGLETPSPQSNPCHVSTLNRTHSTRAGSICFSRLLFSRLRQRCLALCFGAMRTPLRRQESERLSETLKCLSRVMTFLHHSSHAFQGRHS